MSRPRNAESPAPKIVSASPETTWLARRPTQSSAWMAAIAAPGHQRGRGADPGAPRPDAGAGAREGAHQHDPLDAEVEHPGPLGDQLAETGEEDRGPAATAAASTETRNAGVRMSVMASR